MRLVSIYEKTSEQFSNLAQVPKEPRLAQKAPNNSKIRWRLRVRIEGNIENGNCYCIQIEYDDDNEEVEKEEEEEEG